MMENILALKSKRGEISLYDKTDKFMASFVQGKWVADDVFEYMDLEENFYQIQDDAEVLRLLSEARAALGQPLKQAKAG